MQILLLSLLVLLILIGQIYKIIYDKKKMSQEAFDMVNKKKHQEEYWENSIRYYNSLGDKRLQNTIEQIEKNESTDNFVALDSNNVLVETFHGESSRRSTENEIETCRSLTKCEQLDEFPNCGYCGSSNKFDYDGGTGIAPDVCLPSKEIAAYSDGYSDITASSHSPDIERGNQWAKTKYDCLKVQRQNICDKVETCTQMTGTEMGKICGWCPSDSRAKVKTNGQNALLLYGGTGDEEANSKITSDKCPDMGKPDPFDLSGEPMFSTLTQAGSCSVCDEPVAGISKGATGIHSKKCLQSLWAAAYIDPSGMYNVSCNTEYDDIKTANEGHYGKENDMNSGKKPYYLIAAEMKNNLKRPIAKFMREYDELNTIGGKHWEIIEGDYRRDYNIDTTISGKTPVDELWKKCFGENSKGNVEDNFGGNIKD